MHTQLTLISHFWSFYILHFTLLLLFYILQQHSLPRSLTGHFTLSFATQLEIWHSLQNWLQFKTRRNFSLLWKLKDDIELNFPASGTANFESAPALAQNRIENKGTIRLLNFVTIWSLLISGGGGGQGGGGVGVETSAFGSKTFLSLINIHSYQYLWIISTAVSFFCKLVLRTFQNGKKRIDNIDLAHTILRVPRHWGRGGRLVITDRMSGSASTLITTTTPLCSVYSVSPQHRFSAPTLWNMTARLINHSVNFPSLTMSCHCDMPWKPLKMFSRNSCVVYIHININKYIWMCYDIYWTQREVFRSWKYFVRRSNQPAWRWGKTETALEGGTRARKSVY